MAASLTTRGAGASIRWIGRPHLVLSLTTFKRYRSSERTFALLPSLSFAFYATHRWPSTYKDLISTRDHTRLWMPALLRHDCMKVIDLWRLKRKTKLNVIPFLLLSIPLPSTPFFKKSMLILFINRSEPCCNYSPTNALHFSVLEDTFCFCNL